MNTITRFSLLLAMSLLSFLFTGCASRPSGQAAEAGLVHTLLDRLLPHDFRGPAHLEERGQYVTIVIDAGDLHRDAATGRWSWAWLDYQRTLNIPLFAGLPYKQEGKVRMGTPTKEPQP